MNTNPIQLSLTAAFKLRAAGAPQSLAAEVPFDFEANGVPLPGGRYRVQRTALMPALRLVGAASGTAIRFRTKPGDAQFRTHALFFHRYGDRHFLSAVTDDASGVTIELPMGARERQLATNFTPETVVSTAL